MHGGSSRFLQLAPGSSRVPRTADLPARRRRSGIVPTHAGSAGSGAAISSPPAGPALPHRSSRSWVAWARPGRAPAKSKKAQLGAVRGLGRVVFGPSLVADHQGFGGRGYLRHTVRVALRQVRAWSGIRPVPTMGASGPNLAATIWSPTRLREGDTPDRGGIGWTKTGKQRRSIRRNARSALTRAVDLRVGGHQVRNTGSSVEMR